MNDKLTNPNNKNPEVMEFTLVSMSAKTQPDNEFHWGEFRLEASFVLSCGQKPSRMQMDAFYKALEEKIGNITISF